MTSLGPRPHSRRLIPLLVAVLGIALGAVGLALLGTFGSGTPTRLADTAARHAAPAAPRPLSVQAIGARIEPSIVDVTATLQYDGETASGTGFVVDDRTALVLTNNHVVRDATGVTVTVPGSGQTYRARIVGVDVPADIAVLQMTPVAGLGQAPLGDSASVRAGMKVISFGNRAGAGGRPTVAPGVISGTSRTIQAADGASGFTETLTGMLATTARIEPGDSGGPLADTAGTVIGVDTAAGTNGSTTGYAIPINAAMAAERQLAAGRPGPGVSFGMDGFLGVIVGSSAQRSPRVQAAQEQAHSIGTGAAGTATGTCVLTRASTSAPSMIAPAPVGALVIGVLCGTGAATAGIVAGDVVTAVDGRHVVSSDALTALVSGRRPGTVVSVTWVSVTGTARTSRVRLGPAPAL